METNTLINHKQEIATLSTIVVEKNALLNALNENKEKHSAFYDAAVVGYWIRAQEVLDNKKEEFDKSVDSAKKHFSVAFKESQMSIDSKNKDRIGFNFAGSVRVDNGWPLTYPVNHLKDYDRTIRMVEMSIYDKFSLNVNEFESYVLNNWEWKQNFVGSNAQYIHSFTGCYSPIVNISGCALPTNSNPFTKTILMSGANCY